MRSDESHQVDRASDAGSSSSSIGSASFLIALADSFVGRRRRGESPAIEDYETRFPELAERIREIFSLLGPLEDYRSEARLATSPPDDDHPLGELPELAGYRLTREIGRGGMGVVYEAWDEKLGRRVAIKVLAERLSVTSSALERFEREARSAATLDHGNIVPVFRVGEENGLRFIVMQLIQGRGLDRVLDEVANRSSADPELAGLRTSESYARAVAGLGLQAARALAFSHSHGVLHRDVKPSNLILDVDGKLWVADFGLAKLEGAPSITGTGEVLGTLRYMPPERFSGESLPSGDVYSLGLTLYELLAGRPAFDDTDRSRLLKRVLVEDPQRLRNLDPSIPRDLEAIVTKAIQKEPRQRFGSAAALAEDLDRFLGRRPLRWAHRAGLTERATLWCRRNPLSTVLLMSTTLLVSLLVASVTFGWLEARSPRAGQDAPAGRSAERASVFEDVQTVLPGEKVQNVIAVDVVDLDGDGLEDLVALGFDSDHVAIIRQTEKRRFRPLPPVAVGSKPAALAVLDADRDGKKHIVVANRESKDLSVLLQSDDGRFRAGPRLPLGFKPFGLVAIDIDRDGDTDLVAAGGAGNARCFRGDRSGRLEPGDLLTLEGAPTALAAGRVSGATRPDLVFVDMRAQSVSVVPWTAEKALATRLRASIPGLPVAAAVENLLGDERAEVVVASYQGELVTVLSNGSRPGVLQTRTIAVGSSPLALATGDLTGDPAADIAVANELPGGVTLLENLGDGEFRSAGFYATEGFPSSVRVADLDGDGALDVIVSGGKRNNVGVLWNRGARGARGATRPR